MPEWHDNAWTIEFFNHTAKGAAAVTRDDIIKLGNVLAGAKYMKVNIKALMLMRRDVLAAEIKSINEHADAAAWIEMFEDLLGQTFRDGVATPATERGGRRKGIGKARLPRFQSLMPGTPFETLGEKLARTGRLDSFSLP